MKLANLDNEVFFKKVFTEPDIFRAFVKDITGVDVVSAKIETEKTLERKVAAIRFKLDIYAESSDKRILIEIQRIDYDYSFDRFMHYFLAALVDLQRSSKDYAFEQEVYTIIVLTTPYIVKDDTGKLLQDDVLISNLNPRTLDDRMRGIYPHRLIFLNPSHTKEETPASIKDWLDLISESIKNPTNPNINFNNPSIAKAADVADVEHMPESVLEDAKIAEATKKTITIYQDKARAETEAKAKAVAEKREEEVKAKEVQIVLGMKGAGLSVANIALITQKTEAEVHRIIANKK